MTQETVIQHLSNSCAILSQPQGWEQVNRTWMGKNRNEKGVYGSAVSFISSHQIEGPLRTAGSQKRVQQELRQLYAIGGSKTQAKEVGNTDVINNLAPLPGEVEYEIIILLPLLFFFFFLPLAFIISLYHFNSTSTAKELDLCPAEISFSSYSLFHSVCMWWLNRDGHTGSAASPYFFLYKSS